MSPQITLVWHTPDTLWHTVKNPEPPLQVFKIDSARIHSVSVFTDSAAYAQFFRDPSGEHEGTPTPFFW